MFKLLCFKKRQSGFTLLELLIVVAIIAVLVVVGAFSYTLAQKRARDTQRRSDLKRIALALEEYFADHLSYPSTSSSPHTACQFVGSDSLCCLLGGTIAQNLPQCKRPYNTYIAEGQPSKFPTDPLNNQHYVYASNGQTYVVVARGYEGTPPAENLFDSTDPYYSNIVGWDSSAAGKYFIKDPTN